MMWRSVKEDPPKAGTVIVARGAVNTIIGKVVDRSAGGLRTGCLCIEGIWINTGNQVVRMVAEAEAWLPLKEVMEAAEMVQEYRERRLDNV